MTVAAAPASLAEAHEVIRRFSNTWYDSVLRLPSPLDRAVSSTYLLLRGIDELEDRASLGTQVKVRALHRISEILQGQRQVPDFSTALNGLHDDLPDVSLRLSDWMALAPADIAPRIQETIATMSGRMAQWTASGWKIQTLSDFERYANAVVGTAVLLLCDLWTWFDGTRVDRSSAPGYARALQAINVYCDRAEDLLRKVDFWPNGWTTCDMRAYIETQLPLAQRFVTSLPEGSPGRDFCAGVLQRARAALPEPDTEART